MPEVPPPVLTYDPVARTVHWLSFLLAVIATSLAYGISGAPRHGAAREWLLMLHGSVGIAILPLMLFWGAWRLRHSAPPLRPVLAWIEVLLARATQAAIFLLFILMPVTGYAALAAAGNAVSFFGLVAIPPLVPQSGRLAQAAIALHLSGQLLIYALLAMHIGAALLHRLVRRDGILERMLPRQS
jgi:cytochrome b561